MLLGKLGKGTTSNFRGCVGNSFHGNITCFIFQIHTPDLGGTSTTLEVVQAIIEDIKPKARSW